MLEEVASIAPELVGWARSCYAEHSNLYVQGHLLSNQKGVQQGDPLGPLFFALTWQRVVRQLPSDLVINLWYLDDGHLIGKPTQLLAELDTLGLGRGSGSGRIGQNHGSAGSAMSRPMAVPWQSMAADLIESSMAVAVPWQNVAKPAEPCRDRWQNHVTIKS